MTVVVALATGARGVALRLAGAVPAAHGARGRRALAVARQRHQRDEDRARVGAQVHGLRAAQAAHPRRLGPRPGHLRALRRRLHRRLHLADGHLPHGGPSCRPGSRHRPRGVDSTKTLTFVAGTEDEAGVAHDGPVPRHIGRLPPNLPTGGADGVLPRLPAQPARHHTLRRHRSGRLRGTRTVAGSLACGVSHAVFGSFRLGADAEEEVVAQSRRQRQAVGAGAARLRHRVVDVRPDRLLPPGPGPHPPAGSRWVRLG